MNEEPIILIEGLSVRYGALEAVSELSLTVRRCRVFGLLGPNGAGKSSILSCVEGLRRPSAGRVLVGGHDLAQRPQAAKAMLGVQLQKSAMFNELSALELVTLVAALYKRFPTRAEALTLLERFGLGEKAHTGPGRLSGGQQQRLALALAVVNDPAAVLLDEPTAALDPQARRAVWALIERLRAAAHHPRLAVDSKLSAGTVYRRPPISTRRCHRVTGSPGYLRAYGHPRTPTELAQHRCLTLALPAFSRRNWTFTDQRGRLARS